MFIHSYVAMFGLGLGLVDPTDIAVFIHSYVAMFVSAHHCVDSLRERQELNQFWNQVEIQQRSAELAGVSCVRARDRLYSL